MRRLWLVLLIVIGAGAAYVAAHGALIEVGREVIVLRTQDDGGAWRTGPALRLCHANGEPVALDIELVGTDYSVATAAEDTADAIGGFFDETF